MLSNFLKMIKIDRNLSELWQIVRNVKHQLFLSDFKENSNFLDKFSQNTRTSNFMKIRPVKLSCSLQMDGRTRRS